MTMSRPSLVTSSGPSPVLGFMAAIRRPLSLFADAGLAVCGQPSRRVVRTSIPRVRFRGKSTPRVRPIEAVRARVRAAGRLSGDTRRTECGGTVSQTVDAPVGYDVQDAVAVVRLRRPEAMNSLDRATKV